MREISMHILDIVQNSVSAGASLVTVDVLEDAEDDLLTVRIEDNGKGMSPEFAHAVLDPFVTTRTTRKVGLGLPMLAQAAEQAGGSLAIWSQVGVGTTVTATFKHSSIDRPPLGDMAGTVMAIAVCNPGMDFVYNHVRGAKSFTLDTREVKAILEDLPLNHPDVAGFIRDYVEQGERELAG